MEEPEKKGAKSDAQQNLGSEQASGNQWPYGDLRYMIEEDPVPPVEDNRPEPAREQLW